MPIQYDNIQEIIDKYSCIAGDHIVWIGERDKDGYGRYTVNIPKYGVRVGRWVVSRLIFTLAYGDIPDGMNVLHTCDTPSCIKLEHLYLGTQHNNTNDAISRGRYKTVYVNGEQHPMARLTDEDIITIHYLHTLGFSPLVISIKFGVTRNWIHQILRNKVRVS